MNVEGDHTLYLCAEDQATNQATMWSGRYRLDKTRPTVNLLTYANASTNGWTNNTSINLTWTAMDPPAAVPAGVIASQVKNYDINVYCKFGAQ